MTKSAKIIKKKLAKKRLNIVLVGTKLDLINIQGPQRKQRQVTTAEAKNFAERMNLVGFIETSTKQ